MRPSVDCTPRACVMRWRQHAAECALYATRMSNAAAATCLQFTAYFAPHGVSLFRQLLRVSDYLSANT